MSSLTASQEVTTLEPRKLLTTAEVAEQLGIPKSTIYEAARHNRIGGVVRLGRVVRFDANKLENWIDSGGQPLPPERT